MSRMGVALFVLVALVGCRAPGFDPLGLSGPTRVPPPPTGTVGDLSSGYYEPVPRPSVNTGAANWPATDYAPPQGFASNRDTSVGVGSTYRPSVASRSELPAPPRNGNAVAAADTRPTLQKTDADLNWLDPASRYGSSSYDAPVGNYAAGNYAAGNGRAYAPRLLPVPGVTQPIVAAPRIRGFPNSGRQDIYVPPELAQFRSDGVRQASVNSQWQPRYDDVRR